MNRFRLIIFLFCILISTGVYCEEKPAFTQELDFKMSYGSVNDQSYGVHVNYHLPFNLGIDIGYAYFRLHSFTGVIQYRFNFSNYYLYPFMGYGLFVDSFSPANKSFSVNYLGHVLNLGAGVEANLTDLFFIQIEVAILKYFAQEYSGTKINFKESLPFDEEKYYNFSLGVAFGYRLKF